MNLQPLVVRSVWYATTEALAATRILASDGGLVPAQVRGGFRGELFAEPTTPLTEGESYFLQYPTSCLHTTDTHLEPFTVTAAVDLSMPLVSVHVADSGVAPIYQDAFSACSAPWESSYASFRFDVDANHAELLPFVSWSLALLPQDGGTPIEWTRETAGGVLADGGLGYWHNLQHAPPRIQQVWHLCEGADAGPLQLSPGAPAGLFRAQLTATYPAGDAGFVSVSEPFELADCSVTPTGGGAGATGGGAGATGGGAGATGGGAGATGGGTGANPDGGTGGGGTPGGTGCSTTALALPLLALLAFRRRRD